MRVEVVWWNAFRVFVVLFKILYQECIYTLSRAPTVCDHLHRTMASSAQQPRVLCFSYHNLDLGAFRVTMWLRESVDPVTDGILREVNFGGTTGFHGGWRFVDEGIQPFNQLNLQFNSRWPVRQELLAAVLLRVSAIEWHGHDYARRTIHISHTDTYVRQLEGLWLSERTRGFIQVPIPAIRDVPMLPIQDVSAGLVPMLDAHYQSTPQRRSSPAPDDESRAVRRRLR